VLKQYLIIFGTAISIGGFAVLYAVFGQTERSRKLLSAIFVSILIGWLDFNWGIGLLHQFNTRNYAQTTGEIIHQEVTHNWVVSRFSHNQYDVAISYRYLVNGQPFVGNRIRLIEGSCGFSGNSIVKWGHSVGSQIPVFYNDRNPQDSFLSVGLNQADDSITLIILAAANSLGLYLWFSAWRQSRIPPEQSTTD
jgi:hypothetical protein